MNQIVIVGDQATRRKIEIILQGNEETQIVDYVYDGRDALRICSQTEVHLILMVIINDFEPIHWIRVISAKFPEVKSLIVIESYREDVLFMALKYGATGYMLLTDDCKKIADAINLCILGFVTMEQRCIKSLISLIAKESK